MLYGDRECKLDAFLNAASESTTEVVDEYGVTNQLCFIAGDGLQRCIAEERLIIADGHHRYETALTYRNEQRAAGHAEGPHDWAMMTFVNLYSPALIILPTHRVVFGLEPMNAEELSGRLHGFFEIEMLTTREPGVITRALQEAGRDGSAFAVITRDAALILRANRERTARVLSGYTEAQQRLDVLVLHKVVLEHALGISEDAIREQRNVRYHRWADDAIRDVDAGGNAAFLLNAVPIDLFRDLTFAGTLMPQKSTDFYPKLLSGFTMYALDEALESADTEARSQGAIGG
jgi:uncharacterized protein (DUF1015 family)